MSQVSDYALNRLVSLCARRQPSDALAELRQLHQAFLRSMVDRGRPLNEAELATAAPGSTPSLRSSRWNASTLSSWTVREDPRALIHLRPNRPHSR